MMVVWVPISHLETRKELRISDEKNGGKGNQKKRRL
jgi:hypothetical protein